MSEEKTITARLKAIIDAGDVTSKGAAVISDAIEEIDEYEALAIKHQKDAQEARTEKRTATDALQAITNENNELRDQLHGLSLQNAHLQGYQSRVREFDPVSDSRVYEDQAHPIMMRPPAANRDYASEGHYPTSAAGLVSPFDRPASSQRWYRRA